MTRFFARRPLPRLLSLLLLFTLCVTGMNGCTLHGSRSDPPQPDTESPTEDIPVMGGTEDTTPKKRVAITFDDGPQYYNGEETRSIVDELAKYGFTATFFMVGNRIQSNDDLLPYIVQHGCEIGIHGYTHDTSAYYDSCSDEIYEMEINRTAQAILEQIPDYQIKLMRPVGGRISYERVNSSPYSVIMWSVDSDDWNNRYSGAKCECNEEEGITCEHCQTVVNTIVNNVMTQVSDGDIILLHDIYLSTYDATVVILQRLYEEGYDVVSVSELLGDRLEPGQKYYSYWE